MAPTDKLNYHESLPDGVYGQAQLPREYTRWNRWACSTTASICQMALTEKFYYRENALDGANGYAQLP